jgi:hypothetical protein
LLCHLPSGPPGQGRSSMAMQISDYSMSLAIDDSIVEPLGSAGEPVPDLEDVRGREGLRTGWSVEPRDYPDVAAEIATASDRAGLTAPDVMDRAGARCRIWPAGYDPGDASGSARSDHYCVLGARTGTERRSGMGRAGDGTCVSRGVCGFRDLRTVRWPAVGAVAAGWDAAGSGEGAAERVFRAVARRPGDGGGQRPNGPRA